MYVFGGSSGMSTYLVSIAVDCCLLWIVTKLREQAQTRAVAGILEAKTEWTLCRVRIAVGQVRRAVAAHYSGMVEPSAKTSDTAGCGLVLTFLGRNQLSGQRTGI